jgi:hypothetical protein
LIGRKNEFNFNKDAGMYVCFVVTWLQANIKPSQVLIETASNKKLKNRYGYERANAYGKRGMTIPGMSALFWAKMKRICK